VILRDPPEPLAKVDSDIQPARRAAWTSGSSAVSLFQRTANQEDTDDCGECQGKGRLRSRTRRGLFRTRTRCLHLRPTRPRVTSTQTLPLQKRSPQSVL